jgi:site-specific recombinase XerC
LRTFRGPTIKQKLAAVRMLYDFLVVRQITPSNPAHSVRGPKYVVKKGKTPVWSREDAKTLLDSIPKDSVSGTWRSSPRCSTASPV